MKTGTASLDRIRGPRTRPSDPAAREASGITSRLVLIYVRRIGGPGAVERVLQLAGLKGRQDELLDENCWFSYDEKMALFEASATVLNDPQVMFHIGQAAIDLEVGDGLKIALRALGTPRLVYQNVVRATAKFTGSHEMEILDLGSDHATVRYRDVTDQRRYQPLDCQYNRGFLACIPQLFGQARAHVSHPVCGCEGGDTCIYEIRWEQGSNIIRAGLGSVVTAASAITLAAIAVPPLVPVAIAASGGLISWQGIRFARFHRARIERLENAVEDQARVFERLGASLQDLVSELRLGDVLAKVTRNAQVALPGREFVLMLCEPDGSFRCQDTVDVPVLARDRLETWGSELPAKRTEPTTVDDVKTVETLAPLATSNGGNFRSACAAPLVFRDQRLGILVALSPGGLGFLPHDYDVIRSYGAQAAIAIANARLYETAEEMASRDHLTGLLNHREFHEAMERELSRAKRYGGRFSVVMFDLDQFKQINDARGHAHGDHVLAQVGGAFASSCRASDLAFRIGGDELALLLPDTEGGDAEAVALRAQAAIVSVPGVGGASFGVTTWPSDAESKDDLLEQADGRLYEMKRDRLK